MKLLHAQLMLSAGEACWGFPAMPHRPNAIHELFEQRRSAAFVLCSNADMLDLCT